MKDFEYDEVFVRHKREGADPLITAVVTERNGTQKILQVAKAERNFSADEAPVYLANRYFDGAAWLKLCVGGPSRHLLRATSGGNAAPHYRCEKSAFTNAKGIRYRSPIRKRETDRRG